MAYDHYNRPAKNAEVRANGMDSNESTMWMGKHWQIFYYDQTFFLVSRDTHVVDTQTRHHDDLDSFLHRA